MKFVKILNKHQIISMELLVNLYQFHWISISYPIEMSSKEERQQKAITYLKDNLIIWKASYEGCELIENTVKVSNVLDKDISLFYRHYKQKQPK